MPRIVLLLSAVFKAYYDWHNKTNLAKSLQGEHDSDNLCCINGITEVLQNNIQHRQCQGAGLKKDYKSNQITWKITIYSIFN